MCGLKHIFNLIKYFREKTEQSIFFEVKRGSHTEWISQEEWLRRQKDRIYTQTYQGETYDSNKQSQIRSIAVFPISSISRRSE